MPTQNIAVSDEAPAWQRVAVLAIALLVFAGGYRLNSLLLPTLLAVSEGFEPGAKTVFEHVTAYSTATGVVCLVGWWALSRWGRLVSPWRCFSVNSDVVLTGGATAIAVCVLTGVVWLVMGQKFGLHFGGAKAVGDAFSNLYEEISYRGLIFGAALYATRRPIAAALISGVVFALTHHQYPLFFQVLIVFVGAAFAAAYFKTGSLVAAWTAHQLSDVVLDSVLQ